MKIVIAGGGAVGFHLAKLLASEQQDITLIDTNLEILDNVNVSLDVKTIAGDASSISVLEEALKGGAKLFLAVTASEKVNIVASILAKRMGAKMTVARVNNEEYLTKKQLHVFEELGIDHLISPSKLAAEEISRLLVYQGVTDAFSFEEDEINLFGIFLNRANNLLGKSLHEVNQRYKELNFKPIAILRGRNTLLPEENLILRRNDHVYFLSDKQHRDELLPSLGIQKGVIKKIMIIGGGLLGQMTAKLLEDKNHEVVIVEESKNMCKKLIEKLNNTLIVKGDPSDNKLLIEEGLENMDAFIALTPNSETNILTSLMASESGVKKTIALVDNIDYIHISQHIGVDTLINKKLIAANNIFKHIRKGKIEVIVSLHGVDAEIIEFIIPNKSNRLTTKPIGKLKMPKGAIIGTVIRNKECIIPESDFTFKSDDKVIVVALPEAIQRVEKIFK